MVRSPFTDANYWSAGNIAVTNDFIGSLPYTTVPVIDHPYAHNLRPERTPPVVAPGPQSRNKAGVPVQVTPRWWGSIGGATLGPGAAGQLGRAPAATSIVGRVPSQ